ncbi:MAG TPA: TolC family protein [Thermoanaerobaculia bacterium]|jgi:cobalt-zinc-cadmium efflux system outer membrane protein|nr:TolC family protein [Thermoanaerobaculia bacterium]
MKRVVMFCSVALFASCASVPRDAGLTDVQQAVTTRTNQSLEWTANDERLRAMLQDELTAEKAVAIAIANNPRLQVTLAELGIARADLIEASTIANPIFEFELRVPGEPYRPYELRLAQSLIELIQLPRRRAIGRAAFDAAQMRVTSDVLRFAADVRSSYFDLVAATQHVAQSRTIVEAARTAAEVAIKQHAAENITDLDLENEQALYEQAKLDLARSERQLVLAQETLTRNLGVHEFRVPAAFPALPPNELDQTQLEQLAAQQRLDLAIARREVEIAQRGVPIARLSILGDTNLDAHYEREPSGEHTVGPGIELPIPIFNTGRAARTRAEAEFLRARHTLLALESEASSQLRAARAMLSEARARVEYYRDVLLPRRRRIVELTKLEHNAMLVGIFQLLQARQNEARAQSDFVEAQREYWSARTDLDRALQGITRGEN